MRIVPAVPSSLFIAHFLYAQDESEESVGHVSNRWIPKDKRADSMSFPLTAYLRLSLTI